MKVKSIAPHEFILRYENRPNSSYCFLLGAGTSAQAGIPTANSITWMLKRKLYCKIKTQLEDKYKDIESEANQEILQRYFDSQTGYPKRASDEEYSFYFEKCYPDPIDRKIFLQGIVRDKKPTIGHKCLAQLILANKLDWVWTTNFDELIESGIKALDHAKSFVTMSPENSTSMNDLDTNFPKVIKLHGDYRYDKLQNTLAETVKLDESLRNKFHAVVNEKGLIVVGYSGRDQSIMKVLKEAVKSKNPFPHGLIWCVRNGEFIRDEVIELIYNADQKNACSGIVDIDGFDNFAYGLYKGCNISNKVIDEIASTLLEKRKPFTFSPKSSTETVKMNAIRIKEYPRTTYSFESSISNWDELRSTVKGKEIVAALFRNKVTAFGSKDNIVEAFKDKIKSEILFSDIDGSALRIDDSTTLHMLYDLISYTLENKLNMKRVGGLPVNRRYYSEENTISNDLGKGKSIPSYYKIYEAMEFQLSYYNNALWFVLMPIVYLKDIRTVENISKADEMTRKYERQRYANQITSNRYNKVVDEKSIFWLNKLKNIGNPITFNVDNFKIVLEAEYSFSGQKIVNNVYYHEPLIVNAEPKVAFHPTEVHYQTVHPLKGLKAWGPYGHNFSSSTERSPNIKLAIISPENMYDKLLKHLNGLNSTLGATYDKGYLIDYSGFSVYKKTFEVPLKGENNLSLLIKENEYKAKTQLEFYELIKRKIDYFYTIRGEFDVLIVYIPDELKGFREQKNEEIYYDLHDSIKIYCAKNNIKVQFIEDKSINNYDPARVRWWLSLGLYVKANGVPWIIKTQDKSTAYIGLGYALKSDQTKNRVVMGCSQVFDESGQGLRFLLRPLDNPVFIHKNPFMSKEDARRIVMSLREAYYNMDPNSKLKRVVIHKTSHFTHDEMEGIAQALEGIDQIELLQIQQNTKWRGIRYNTQYRQSHFYPVLRGTTIMLDEFNFLLWTHGSVAHDDVAGVSKNYYQGARGIPTPLLIKRFRGNGSLETISQEILNLTKMNWNGAELYKTLPVTLDFSKTLSKMAKQTESLQNKMYDFRFFM